MRLALLAASVSVALLACTQEGGKVAGTDTGNPILTATIQDSSGKALPGAQAILYKKSVALDTVIADSKGVVTIPKLDSGAYSLEVYSGDLGAYQTVSVSQSTSSLTVVAGPLVDFPVPATADNQALQAVLAGTGRVLAPGTSTRIPPGLWQVNYVRFGTALADTLPALAVQVDAARGVPAALEGLATASSKLDSMKIKTHGYVALSRPPTQVALSQSMAFACSQAGFDVTACSTTQDCRIWQWLSDWVTVEADPSATPTQVLAGVVTWQGQTHCVFFSDGAISAGAYFYSLGEVRKAP